MTSRFPSLALLLLALPCASLLAADKLVTVQAESGVLGSDCTVATDNSVAYFTEATDFASTSAPGNDTKVATYTVTFPQAGTYNLFARVRVGPGGASDDSFYYASSFGAKNSADGALWITVNALSNIGYTVSTDTVDSAGTAATGVWKWIRLSTYGNAETGVTFLVPAGALTQTFQVGTRENGLDFDQFAFGLVGNNFTVANLLNTAPVITAAQTFAAYKGAAVGDFVGTALATDVDAGTTLQSWTITGGTGVSVFAINPTTGNLTVLNAARIDPVANPSYTLDLTVGDGVLTSAIRTVTVDVVEPTTIAILPIQAGLRGVGQTLAFTVALNRTMTVDTAGGTPALAFTIGATPRQAAYASGSGTDKLTFTYTVQAGDNDADGIALISPLALNGGTIRDDTSTDIGLDFTAPSTGGVLIDTTAPAAAVVATFNTRTLTGTAESASTVRIYLDGVLNTTVTASGAGTWSAVVNTTGITAGSHSYTVTATATDAAGNTGPASAGFPATIVIDPNAPIIVQAESGVLGSDFQSLTSGGAGYITPATDTNTVPNTQCPGVAIKVATYSVFFPQAGTYNLYARVRVGPAAASDDSCYYGNGFGVKDVVEQNAWITVNGLSTVGFTTTTDPVTAEGSVWGPGAVTTNSVWKWVRLSSSNFGEGGIQLTVPEGGLTQTFQYGSRENGLDIDQFAFGLDGVFFTVAQLNAGTVGTTTPPPPPYVPNHPPLATDKVKFLGCAHSTLQAPNFLAYFNQLTPENGGKWGSVEPTRDVMNWTELDAQYAVAKTNGLKFRFHILVWGNQQPAWIESLSAADQLDEIKEWFAAVAARYPDLDYIEVVNEALHDPPAGAGNGNYLPALGGNGVTGWDWILNAFRLARQYFPGKKLMLNEYSVTNDGPQMARYVEIVNLLKTENLIDLVGVQAHAFSTTNSAASITANLDTLAATGIPIMVTEMDVDGPTDQVQLDDYKRIFRAFWEHPGTVGITLWGYRPGLWRANANLVLANGAERPAMLWLKDFVRNNIPVVTAGQTFYVGAAAANGAVVGTVLATDADPTAVLQGWAIKGGTAAAAFTINAATGQLTLSDVSKLDFAANPISTVRIAVGDELSTSVTTTVTILQGFAPVFTAEPVSQSTLSGLDITFTAAASGTPVPAYQWQISTDAGTTWTDLADNATYAGTATGTLTVHSAALAMNGSRFHCIATNAVAPAATSAVAALTVTAPANYAAWATAHGVIGGANDDPEGFGVTNLLRYAFALPASGPVSSPTTVSLVDDAGARYLQIAFRRQAVATDIVYLVEASEDLVNWSYVAVYLSGTPADVLARDTVAIGSVPRRFLRVEVIK